MELATIRGVVVATKAHPSLVGVRLLVAQPEDVDGKPVGDPVIVADPLQAGPGQKVWIVHGREAALALPETFAPVDHAVVAIADDVERT